MTEQNPKKELHQLLEDDFQHLLDTIEQKQIVHEPVAGSDLPAAEAEPLSSQVAAGARRLQNQSRELGATTLAEFFQALQDKAEDGDLESDDALFGEIQQAFEGLQQLLNSKTDH